MAIFAPFKVSYTFSLLTFIFFEKPLTYTFLSRSLAVRNQSLYTEHKRPRISRQCKHTEIPSPSGTAAQADSGGGREAAAKTAGMSPVVLT